MQAVLDSSCNQFICSDSILLLKTNIIQLKPEFQLGTIGKVDDTLQNECFCMAFYSVVVDFTIPSDNDVVFRLYYDAGDLGGTSATLFLTEMDLSLSYYTDDYNTWDQNLLINNEWFYTLHIHQEDITDDEQSHIAINNRYIKLPSTKNTRH